MNPEIIIVGAGAAGLMAARELGKAGKKVTVLEARNRIGGRIMPLHDQDFGYPAQGGAEWVHGEAPTTKALVKEAGLTLVPEGGEIWSVRSGELAIHKAFILDNDLLKKKLEDLKEDMPIADFLDQNFKEEKDKDFKSSIIKMVEGYDAADPKLMSTFTLRDEWLGKPLMTQIVEDTRIKEGYGALLDFLEKECKKYDVEIRLNTSVNEIEISTSSVSVHTTQKEIFNAQKVIVTVPLPVLKDIKFNPELRWKQDLVSEIGFGNVMKVLFNFKTRWWENSLGKDLSKMAFMLCNEEFMTWWTQWPEINNVLTGWMAGPKALKYKNFSDEKLIDMALTSLSNVFKVDKDDLRNEVVFAKAVNWTNDPFTKGAYSYTTFRTNDAYEKLSEPYNNAIFFAGEALYTGTATATVEGALCSGSETAQRILKE